MQARRVEKPNFRLIIFYFCERYERERERVVVSNEMLLYILR